MGQMQLIVSDFHNIRMMWCEQMWLSAPWTLGEHSWFYTYCQRSPLIMPARMMKIDSNNLVIHIGLRFLVAALSLPFGKLQNAAMCLFTYLSLLRKPNLSLLFFFELSNHLLRSRLQPIHSMISRFINSLEITWGPQPQQLRLRSADRWRTWLRSLATTPSSLAGWTTSEASGYVI